MLYTGVVACKNLRTGREGTGHMRWMSVVTAPGRLYPRDFERKGGGYDEDGAPRARELPTLVDSGDDFRFNLLRGNDRGGAGMTDYLVFPRKRVSESGTAPPPSH